MINDERWMMDEANMDDSDDIGRMMKMDGGDNGSFMKNHCPNLASKAPRPLLRVAWEATVGFDD